MDLCYLLEQGELTRENIIEHFTSLMTKTDKELEEVVVLEYFDDDNEWRLSDIYKNITPEQAIINYVDLLYPNSKPEIGTNHKQSYCDEFGVRAYKMKIS